MGKLTLEVAALVQAYDAACRVFRVVKMWESQHLEQEIEVVVLGKSICAMSAMSPHPEGFAKRAHTVRGDSGEMVAQVS